MTSTDELLEIQSRLKKEIAFAQWKLDHSATKEHLTIGTYVLATLKIVEGTHSHDPEYDEEFERGYNAS